MMAFQGTIILDSIKASSHVNFSMRVKVLIFINKDFPYNYKSKILGKYTHTHTHKVTYIIQK